eukprot:CAMPEP_0171813356 /NCGR_PEP_ID=MMETSP0991-20121206/79169_1 /TAXON_ID=483369 /ORGANISM="non described non described, Strain CCMP2098" /LENGTH=284 /DNA_ID=CAMNT_0012426927 /DNA_START=189 /DNA_END=1043 /DNA_ORIENTATION=+
MTPRQQQRTLSTEPPASPKHQHAHNDAHGCDALAHVERVSSRVVAAFFFAAACLHYNSAQRTFHVHPEISPRGASATIPVASHFSFSLFARLAHPGRHPRQLGFKGRGPESACVAKETADPRRRRRPLRSHDPRALGLVEQERHVGRQRKPELASFSRLECLPQRLRLLVALQDELDVRQRYHHRSQPRRALFVHSAHVHVVGCGGVHLKPFEPVLVVQARDEGGVPVEYLCASSRAQMRREEHRAVCVHLPQPVQPGLRRVPRSALKFISKEYAPFDVIVAST